MEDSIFLSVVATSRNDNHGKNLLYRMQHFVDGFVEQCKKHNLKAKADSSRVESSWRKPLSRKHYTFHKTKAYARLGLFEFPKKCMQN